MRNIWDWVKKGLSRCASRARSEAGSATAEYTLVTLVAATIALLLLNWAKGGALTNFFQSIFDKVTALFQ